MRRWLSSQLDVLDGGFWVAYFDIADLHILKTSKLHMQSVKMEKHSGPSVMMLNHIWEDRTPKPRLVPESAPGALVSFHAGFE